ncbi:MAG: rubrerythrin family protein [Burkholderiaceae bacterium]|jgi:rubrerythrin|nr:rubrerythrin family protein [Burkholderiaceae bacterium]
MQKIKDSRTGKNLEALFALAAESALRYVYFSRRAYVEGHSGVAQLFHATAEAERVHALGHLDFLRYDPKSGKQTTLTRLNIQSAIESDTHKYHDIYPKMAEIAREEGFDDIANWLETLARAKRMNTNDFQKALKILLD